VREHFRTLHEIVAAEGGAVVKTIGDAVMATFPTPDRGLSAAFRMRDAMRKLNESHGGQEICCSRSASTKGPCLAVTLNGRQNRTASWPAACTREAMSHVDRNNPGARSG